MPMQNHEASYHGIVSIIIGINDESFESVFKCEYTLFSEKASRNHIQQKKSIQIYQKFVQL